MTTPRSLEEAEQTASPVNFGLNVIRDVGISFIDDALFLALPLIENRGFAKPYKAIIGMAKGAVILGGTAAAGAIGGHDAQNWLAAANYLGDHQDQLAASQAIIRDPRINAINGFVNQGIVASQRTQMTGIASPAAGGIMYRMWNNPFADYVNRAVATPGSEPVDDPRPKALGFSVFGGLLGASIGARWGLGKATMFGLAGSMAAGMYGVASSHNPDGWLNAQAMGEVAMSSLPSLAAGGLLYGASSARLGKFGALIAKGMQKTADGMEVGGGWLLRGNLENAKFQTKIVEGTTAGFASFRRDAMQPGGWSSKLGGFAQSMGTRFNRTSVPDVNDYVVNTLIPNVAQATVNTARTPFQAADFVSKQFVTPLFTHQMTGRWEQSLGIGHLMTIIPHNAIAAAAVVSQARSPQRGKHSTTTMPSNNTLHGRIHSSDGDFGYTKDASGQIVPQLY